jgi:hypothetical protein
MTKKEMVKAIADEIDLPPAPAALPSRSRPKRPSRASPSRQDTRSGPTAS